MLHKRFSRGRRPRPGRFMNFTAPAGVKDLLHREIATLEARGLYDSSWLPDPDPVLRKLGKDMAVYRELLSDPRVGPVAESRTGAVACLEWWLEPDSAGKRVMAEVQPMLDGCDMQHVIEHAAQAPLWGCAPLEIVWKKGRRVIAPEKVVGKPMDWFAFTPSGQLLFKSLSNPLGEPLPPRKFLLPRYLASADNPYGQRVLSRCFWPVTAKRGGMQFWMLFLEKFSNPHVIGRLPRGTAKEEYVDLLDALASLVQDAVAVIPDDASVEFMEAGKGATHQLFAGHEDKRDSDITIAIAGQNLTTEVKSGSLAAAQTHFQVRQDLRDRDKKLVAAAVQDLIDWCCEMNSLPRPWPRFAFYEEQDVDLVLAQRDKLLYDQGVAFTPEYYGDTYGIESKYIKAVQAPADQAGFAHSGPDANAQYGHEPQTHADPFLAEAARDLDPRELQDQADKLLAPVLEHINALADAGAGLHELQAQLLDAYPDMDDAALETMLARALFLADLYARAQEPAQ